MPFQYAQTHSPLANTDNRKHKRRVWLVRAHDVQCAPFHAHQYYFRAHCAPCARVKACNRPGVFANASKLHHTTLKLG